MREVVLESKTKATGSFFSGGRGKEGLEREVEG